MSDPIVFPFKRCSKCEQEFPATTEYFHRNKNKPDGLTVICKPCARQRSKAWHGTNRDYANEKRRQYYQEHRAHSLEVSRQWVINNLAKARAIKRRYYETNRVVCIERARQQRVSDPDGHNAKNRERYAKNRDAKRLYFRRYYATHSATINESSKRWWHSKPGIASIYSQRRRARKHNLPVAFTITNWQRCLDYWGHKCCICGHPMGLWHTLAQDHWIPLSDPRPDNPGTVPWNILPLCHGQGGCNNSKFNRDPIEWLQERIGKRRAKQILTCIQAYFEWVKQQ